MSTRNLSVFVRIRPKTSNDKDSDLSEVKVSSSTGNGSSEGVTIGTPDLKCSGSGFTAVFDEKFTNSDVYRSALEKHISKVLDGQTVGCFCYGHTGSGKTHTAVGYDGEKGLLGEALSTITSLHRQRQAGSLDAGQSQPKEDIFFVVRFVEIYNDQGFDLLSEPARAPMTLREDETGGIQYRGKTSRDSETLEVETSELTEIIIKSEEDIEKVVRRGMANRSAGNSNLHSQSSRSHALVQVEVVSQALLDARALIKKRFGEMVPWGSERDSRRMAMEASMFYRDPDTGKMAARPADPTLKEAAEKAHQDFEPYAAAHEAAKKAEVELINSSTLPLCGNFVLVDLAGSESSALAAARGAAAPRSVAGQQVEQTVQAKKEAAQINTSLLALKECIRGLHQSTTTSGPSGSQRKTSAAPARIPFRNSKLTLALRSFLVCDKGCTTVMIANACPVTSQAGLTKSTLQYAQMVAQQK